MKAEILRILQMQNDGKLSQDQAAELLAILADQAREKEGNPTPSEPTVMGAPGPQGDSTGSSGSSRRAGRSGGGAAASAALHSLVDTAVGIGATVGHAATVLGGELVHMVHRDQGGNTVTLSKVEDPTGDTFTFRGNTINVSKVSHLNLRQAEFLNNAINASQVAHVAITAGRFSQCHVSGSSISYITLEGALAGPEATADTSGEAVASSVRGVTFNATKFARVRLLAASHIDAGIFQAASVKDLELAQQSLLRDSRIADSSITGTRLERARLLNFSADRSHIQNLVACDSTLERVTLSATRLADTTFSNCTLTNTRIRRDTLALAGGGKESIVQESTFENCTLTDCDFSGCTFRRTTLRNITVSGMTVRNVDFTGMTIESGEAFKKAAGLTT